ncbi:RNA polymerase II holoenzyme cyclin-like subunit [Puccinia graminis f. sp. tritici]|uniref:RNA polymerase II holoenzyme cyclin-like subunit n=1 Tax=Puccinia graminis f. sp. tritici TaxID=56615 RepID=A0A5B0S7S9_PUCGR|nr:RNA polymerase II holoenzyme cyclin-like subunit [Puccinia graminis f. sp. tritici]
MVVGYPLRIPAIRWRIPPSASGYPPGGTDLAADGRFSPKPGGYPGIPRDTRGQWPAGTWKGFLPAGKVHPHRLEGDGRKPFQPARYMYLAGSKETFPPASPSTPTKVVPLDFFARFPISMSLKSPRALASTRLNRPIYSANSSSYIPSSSAANLSTNPSHPQQSSSSSPVTTKTSGDKAADERVVDILLRMHKARELDQSA